MADLKSFGRSLRLPNFDYSEKNAYFITFCTKNRESILSQIIPAVDETKQSEILLTPIGEIVQSAIVQIPRHYPSVEVYQYAIMPNHVHLLLIMISDHGPKLGRIIQQLKGYITKHHGHPLWQEKYYDHIIRDEADFFTKSQYIENNPAKWAEDEYNPHTHP